MQDQYNLLEWTNGAYYTVGDMVWTVNQRVNLTENYLKKTAKYQETYFVCIKAHTANPNTSPWSSQGAVFWKKDECAKNITACKKRFNKTSVSTVISDVFSIEEKYLNISGLAQTNSTSSINGLKFLQQDESLTTYIDKNFTIAAWITVPNDLDTATNHTVFSTIKTGAYWAGGLLYYLHNNKFVQTFSTITQSNSSSPRFEEIGSLNSSAYTNGFYNNSYGVYEGSYNSIDLSQIKTGDIKELLFFNQEVNTWQTGDFIKGFYRNHSMEGIITEINVSNNPMYSNTFVPNGLANAIEGIGLINQNTIQKTIDTSKLEKKHRPLPLQFNTIDNSLIKVKIKVTTNSSPKQVTTERFAVVEKPNGISWKNALIDAQSLGGRLAVLNTKEKNDIIPIFNGVKFIGGSDENQEGNFRWINGEYVKQGYQNWEFIPSNLSTSFQEPNDGINTNNVVIVQGGQDYMQIYGNDVFHTQSSYKKWDDGRDIEPSYPNNGYIIEYPWVFQNQNDAQISDPKFIATSNNIKKGANNYNLLLMEGINTQNPGGKIKITLTNTDGKNSQEYVLAANEKFIFSNFLYQNNHDKFPGDPDYSSRFRLGLTDWYYADYTTNPIFINKNGFNAPKGQVVISQFKKFVNGFSIGHLNIGEIFSIGDLTNFKKAEYQNINFNSWKVGDYIEFKYPYENIVLGAQINSIITNSSTDFSCDIKVLYRSNNVFNLIPTSEIVSASTSYTWSQAKTDAESKGGRLFCAKNLNDWNVITNRHLTQMSTSRCWIGASDKDQEGNWKWIDGTLFFTGTATRGGAISGLYNNWSTAEPNNVLTIPGGENYAHTWQQSDGDVLRWNDIHDTATIIKSYILERPMDIKVYRNQTSNDTRANSYTSPINYHGLAIWDRTLTDTEKQWLERDLANDIFSAPSAKLPRKLIEIPQQSRAGLNITGNLIGWWQDRHAGVLNERGGTYKWITESGEWPNGDIERNIVITGVGVSTNNLIETYITSINRNYTYTKKPNYYLPFGGFPGTYTFGYNGD